jgi:enoyl-[acyl-carrier-protein] reductase (NADH)
LVNSPLINDDYIAQMPLGRLGEPSDIAEAVRYLAGPESSWTTGQVFAVDGGHTLRRGPDMHALMEQSIGADAVRTMLRGGG